MLMKRKKQQKFHETLVGMLYPLEEMPEPDQVELNLVATITEGLEKDLDEETSNSSSDMDGTVAQKLTRAQRKRLKRKKLKESASRRRKIIGPLLPSTPENTEDGPCILVEDEPSPMDSTYGLTHAFETSPKIGRPDELEACTPQNKVKRRRIAKRASGNTVRLMAPV